MNLTVQVKLNGLVSFTITADSLEEGLSIAHKKLEKINFYNENIEDIDTEAEITGIY